MVDVITTSHWNLHYFRRRLANVDDCQVDKMMNHAAAAADDDYDDDSEDWWW